MKKALSLLFLLLLLLPGTVKSQDDEYLERLERELSAEERFLESIIEELISKGNREFIETLIYRMGYERAQEKLPRFFFLTQFGGGETGSAGFGIHIYNRQFYTYLSGGYTVYGKYKDYSISFINEVKHFDIYFYERDRIDFLLGGKISYYSEPGKFLSSIEIKQIFSFYGWFFSPYTVFNLFFDQNIQGNPEVKYQIGIGLNFYPWG
jgi:hypothetical protein